MANPVTVAPATVTPLGVPGARVGFVHTLTTNFVSGTGTAGSDNVAAIVQSITVAANTLNTVGDRMRIRSYWRGDTGSPITATLTLNGITLSATTDSGAASLAVNEAWLHYIDATHANIISVAGGTLDPAYSAPNAAGFSWAQDQSIGIAQSQVANNHIVVFFLAADIFPKGVS